MKTTLPFFLMAILSLLVSTVYAQETPNKQPIQKMSAENPYVEGVITEHTIDDKGNTVIRKRGIFKPVSSPRKTSPNKANPTNPSTSSATFQKSEKKSPSVAVPAISEIKKIEQEIIALQNSDKADKTLRISKLEKLLEKKKIEQALLRNQ